MNTFTSGIDSALIEMVMEQKEFEKKINQRYALRHSVWEQNARVRRIKKAKESLKIGLLIAFFLIAISITGKMDYEAEFGIEPEVVHAEEIFGF